MKKYKVTISVDENTARRVGEDDENLDDKLEWIIENEFGWLVSSGITLRDVKEIKGE